MVDSTLHHEIKMTLKMEKMEIRKARNNEQAKFRYAKKVQENPEFYKQEKIRIREYNRNRYAVDPEFAERLRSKRREVYQLKKEVKLSA
jgi:hypothetical protein